MRLIVFLLCVFITTVFFGTGAAAQYLEQEFAESTLPEELRAFDLPNDAGGSIGMSWKVSPSDSPDVDYIIYVSTSENGPWREAVRITSTTGHKSDVPALFGFRKKQKNYHFVEIEPREILTESNVKKPYYFKLAMVKGKDVVEFDEVVSARAKGNWFDLSKLNNFIII
ncbi:MAG: hypothetical protein J3T61_11170, partial [Candidatus Brocadiales bacterium]|nr:hypothetical protein [Candidatus Bathyanammoxibius sp.]